MSALHNAVTALAPGKINLYLTVGEPGPDGYHPLATLFAATALAERVSAGTGTSPGIELSMSIIPGSPVALQVRAGALDPDTIPLNEQNLAHRAAVAVLNRHGIDPHELSLHLHIDKAIPVAGGMAGGSADAAAALLVTEDYLLKTGMISGTTAPEELASLAGSLGADVPFALRAASGSRANRLAVGEGAGTILHPVPLPEDAPPLHLVLVAAGRGLSTPEVFKELDTGRNTGTYPEPEELTVPAELLDALTGAGAPVARLHEVARHIRNDLQAPAVALAPELSAVLGLEDESIVCAFISGSGPTVALLMEDAPAAEELAAALRRRGKHAIATRCL